MRAVWSFWSKPFFAHRRGAWASERHHLLSWVLSLETAKRHYGPTALYTDDAGAALLIDRLGLEFDEVHLSLDRISESDPGWWALGKLHSYAAQTAPFVHIDSDVFLWKRLPARLEGAALIAQNPEPFEPGASFYQPELFEQALEGVPGAWLPVEWRWFRASGLPQRGECCGIVGGHRVDFVAHYAAQALRLLEQAPNRSALTRFSDKIGHNVEFEQYLLAACIEYHRQHADRAYGELGIEYLFPSVEAAFGSELARDLGYTHLIADAKRDPGIANRLEARVARDYPAAHRRCLSCTSREGSVEA